MRLEAGEDVDLPYVPPEYIYFINILFESGPATYSRDGVAPLSWRELDAYKTLCGVSLAPWQARLIRSLSSDYVIEYNAARAQDAPPPWDFDPSENRRAKVGKHIRRVLRGE